MPRLHVHRGFIESLKLCLNLCSLRWLNPSRSLVINLSPSGLKMPSIELGMGRIIFIKLALKILKLDARISLLHSFIVHGKKEDLNASVLQEYVAILLVFQVLYKWNSEGINSAK